MKRSAALFPIVLALGAMILLPRAATSADTREERPTEIEKCQTIDKPGSYKLVKNITFTGTGGNCLNITADLVTIDLAGFAIIGSGVGTAIGLPPQRGIEGIAVRNGTISNFDQGVNIGAVGGTQGAVVEGLRVAHVGGTGIVARGIVRGNTVVGCGHGILTIFGTVTNNHIATCTDGIDVVDGVVSGNTVSGGSDTGITIERSTAIGNTVTFYGVGISANCPANLTDNTAVENGTNLVLNGNGCNNTNNVAP